MTAAELDLVAIGVIAVGAAILCFNIRSSKPPLPPGLPRLPLIGSLLSIPSNEPNWEWYSKLSKKTGSDIVHFDVLGSHTVVLNSREAVAELLERRSGSYSDRPHLVMANELAGWDQALGMANYARAKQMRPWVHKSMNTKAMQEWEAQLEQETLRFLKKLMHTPEQFADHIKQYARIKFGLETYQTNISTAGATVVRLTYGYHPRDEHDEMIEAAQRGMDSFAKATTPGAFAVDVFPILKYNPWAGFHQTAAMWREEIRAVVDGGMDFVRDQMNKGVAEPSFVTQWLESAQPEDNTIIPFTAASLFAAASDNTVAAVSTFFLAMLHYPDVQRKAQAEIDRVVGTDRLPTLSDRDQLPYVEGLYKELFRWDPITPLGLPHKYSGDKDDEFRGMRIPTGSMVIANVWAFLQDPDVHKDPAAFNPERYTGPVPEPDPEDVTFGFGRRRCPGVPIAHASVWLSTALVLAAFDIKPCIGEDGKPEIPPLEYIGTTIRHPKPFMCRILPRSEKTRRMVEGMAV